MTTTPVDTLSTNDIGFVKNKLTKNDVVKNIFTCLFIM